MTDERDRLDRRLITGFLKESYWAKDKPEDLIWRSIDQSSPYGLYAPTGGQVGFLRVISDGVFFAWIGDVFVVPEYRRRGLARWMLGRLLYASNFRDIPKWQLSTDDQQRLYARFGFRVFEGNGEFMTLTRPSPWT